MPDRSPRRGWSAARRALPVAGILLLCAPLGAQERPIVSSEIAVSRADATLRLELADDRRLEISFRDGTILIDGEPAGTYMPGDALESSWRALLGQAVSLDGEPLHELLVDWEPPADAEGDAGARVDGALSGGLAPPPAQPAAPRQQQEGRSDTLSGLIDGTVLQRLLGSTDRLRELTSAIEGLSVNGVRVHAGESVTIGPDDEVRGTLLVVDGDVDLQGRVDGNVVVLGGTLNLAEGSRVTGDVRWADGRVSGNRDAVDGRITRVRVAPAPAIAPEAPARPQAREVTRRQPRGFSPLRHIGRGIAGLFQNLITFAILSVIGFGVIHFARERVEVVARTARRSTARAGAVGFAGTFLLIPVWILGTVALAITIIGIPALIAWIPLFPLAVALAMLFGYVAVALNIGEWLAAQRLEKLPWLRASNPLMAMIGGFGVLLVPFVAANVLRMGGPWLGALHGLLSALGVIAGILVVTVGFGAVLLSRGGRSTDYAWLADLEPGVDDWPETPEPPPPPPPPPGARGPEPAGAGGGPRAGGPAGPGATPRGGTGAPGGGAAAGGAAGGGPAGEGSAQPGGRKPKGTGSEPAGAPENETSRQAGSEPEHRGDRT